MGYTPPYLEVRKVGTSWTIYPSGIASGDDLNIKTADANPRFNMPGGGTVVLFLANGQGLGFYDATGADYLKVNWVTPDVRLSTYTNYNIALLPNGTGKVKFGTYTATPATDSTGYISILDSAGNARKLMVQA